MADNINTTTNDETVQIELSTQEPTDTTQEKLYMKILRDYNETEHDGLMTLSNTDSTQDVLYPVTRVENVVDSTGKSLDVILEETKANMGTHVNGNTATVTVRNDYTINAGDFVTSNKNTSFNFIPHSSANLFIGGKTGASGKSIDLGGAADIVQLSDNKFLALFCFADGERNGTSLYARVVNTIDGVISSMGNSIYISNCTSSNVGRWVKGYKVSESSVLVCRANYQVDLEIYLLSINGDDISIISQKGISEVASNFDLDTEYFRVFQLTQTKYLMIYSGYAETFDDLYGSICEISGNNISLGVSTKIISEQESGIAFGGDCTTDNGVVLSPTVVFYAYKKNGFLFGRYFTLSSNDISCGNETQITRIPVCNKDFNKNLAEIKNIKDNKYVVIFNANYDSWDNRLGAQVLTLDTNSIVCGIDYLLGDSDSTPDNSLACLVLSTGRILIFTASYYGIYVIVGSVTTNNNIDSIDTNSYIPYFLFDEGDFDNLGVILINDETFAIISTKKTTDDTTSEVENKIVFNIFKYATGEFATLLRSSSDRIRGVAKTSGAGGDTIEIYTPKYV